MRRQEDKARREQELLEEKAHREQEKLEKKARAEQELCVCVVRVGALLFGAPLLVHVCVAVCSVCVCILVVFNCVSVSVPAAAN